mgnify:CR=1 FL=1
MNKKQTKKEKEVIDKFKRDIRGMTSAQIVEYARLSEVEKEKFIKNVMQQSLPVAHENHIDKKLSDDRNSKSSSKSFLIKKEREKGFRSERIWIKGPDVLSGLINKEEAQETDGYLKQELDKFEKGINVIYIPIEKIKM